MKLDDDRRAFSNLNLFVPLIDKISLMFLPNQYGFPFFKGREQKIISLMASSVPAPFTSIIRSRLTQPFLEFDCKVN